MKTDELRIVIFDLETLPDLKSALRYWKELDKFPGKTFKANINSVICAGWKVLGQKPVHCINAWDFPGWKKDVNDDREVCKAIYDVICEADVIVGHNSRRFDFKFLQTRLLLHELPPLPPVLHIDTCAEIKKNTMFINNRLGTLSELLTEVEKEETGGWGLWEDVHNRDADAMRKMESYCKGDIRATEELFKRIRPLIKGMPNANMLTRIGPYCCPSCGSFSVQKRGLKYFKEKTTQSYSCNECGAWSSDSLNSRTPRM